MCTGGHSHACSVNDLRYTGTPSHSWPHSPLQMHGSTWSTSTWLDPCPHREVSPTSSHVLIVFTRWPEVIPIANCTAEMVAEAFVSGWIARFGTPSTLTTDRGHQFEFSLWTQLTRLLGSKHIHMYELHPIVNSLIECLHRQLKASLKAQSTNRSHTLGGVTSPTNVFASLCTLNLLWGKTRLHVVCLHAQRCSLARANTLVMRVCYTLNLNSTV